MPPESGFRIVQTGYSLLHEHVGAIRPSRHRSAAAVRAGRPVRVSRDHRRRRAHRARSRWLRLSHAARVSSVDPRQADAELRARTQRRLNAAVSKAGPLQSRPARHSLGCRAQAFIASADPRKFEAVKDSAPYWFPVVTLVLGAIGGYVADRFREGRSHQRQQEAVRAAFERETLIELQDWVQQLARAIHQSHLADERAFREHRTWGQAMIPDQVDEAVREGFASVQRYRVRVSHEGIRAATQEIVVLASEVTLQIPDDPAAARARANNALTQLAQRTVALNEHIGERLRALA